MPRYFKKFSDKNKKAASFFFGALFSLALFFVLSVLISFPVLAQVDYGTTLGSEFGLGTGTDVRMVIINIIKVLLTFLGLVAVTIVLYGGYLWMTAAGNEQRIELAKQVLKNGLIGLVIILAAYAIVAFIISYFLGAINRGGGGGPGPGPCANCSALGGWIIEDHYPDRNQRGVPRNVHISITFKEPILVVPNSDTDAAKSLIMNATQDPGTGIWSGDIVPNYPPPPPIFLLEKVDDNNRVEPNSQVQMAAMTNAQKKTFTFYPVGLLGNADKETHYRATVKGGANGLTKELGAQRTSAMGGDYTWDFWVSTEIDTTPPQIVDVVPGQGETVARNTSVIVTFSEAIDPMSLVVDPATNVGETITFNQTNPVGAVAGVYDIINGYRTVTFHTNTKCGVNSCGQDIFCFNSNATVDSLVKSATLLSAGLPTCDTSASVNAALLAQGNPSLACTNPAGSSSFFDGIVDMSGNSLDGDKTKGKAEGPPDDNYPWTFNTDDTIVKNGPKIVDIKPTNEEAGVSLVDPAKGTFNRRLLRFTTDDFRFYENATRFNPIWARQSITYQCGVSGEVCMPYKRSVCFGGGRDGQGCSADSDCSGGACRSERKCDGGSNVGAYCQNNSDCPGSVCPVSSCSAPPPGEERNDCGRSIAELNHDTFIEDKLYEPRIGSTVLDIYQNCFQPSYGPYICQGGSNDGQSCSVPPSSDTACTSGGGSCVPSVNNLGETVKDVDTP